MLVLNSRLKPLPAMLASRLGTCSWEQRMAPVFGPRHPQGRHRDALGFRLLASVWPSPGHRLFGSGPANGRFLFLSNA